MAFKLTIMITAFQLAYSIKLSGSGNYIILNTCYKLTCSYDTFKDDRQTVYNFVDDKSNGIHTFTIRYLNSTGLCYYRNPDYVPCSNDVCSCDQDGMATHICYNHTSHITGNITIDCFSGTSSIIRIPVASGPDNSIHFIPQSSHYIKKLGESFGPITCSASCYPECQYEWKMLSRTISRGSTLNITSLTKDDDGIYSCKAWNEVYTSGKTITFNLTVNIGPGSSLQFEPSITAVTKKKGDQLGPINCAAACNPPCQYRWTQPDNTVIINAQLMVASLSFEDHGQFTCTATNGIGSSGNKSLDVIVNYGPMEVILLPSTQQYTVEYGETIPAITCSASCRPDCKYMWSGPNDASFVLNLLSLPTIQKNQSGNYYCRASNEVGSMQSSIINVNVLFGPGSSLQFNPGNISITKRKGDKLGPIECRATCNPACHYKWTKPDKTLINDRELMIEPLSIDDHRPFICTASNRLGDVNKKLDVTVSCLPAPPNDLLVICETSPMVVLWKPGFNGGTPQWFTVIWKDMKTNTSIVKSSIPDSDNGQYVKVTTSSLIDGTTYLVYVEASNKYGRVRATMFDNCTTKSEEYIKSENVIAVGVGAGTGTSLMILILAAIVVCICKRLRHRRNKEGNAIYESTQSSSRKQSAKENHLYNDLQQFQGDNNKQHIDDQATYANQSF